MAINKPTYAPGAEPENIKKLLNSFFEGVEKQFPSRTIIWADWDHEHYDKAAGFLCKTLGYGKGSDFLEAYGYKIITDLSEHVTPEEGTLAVNTAISVFVCPKCRGIFKFPANEKKSCPDCQISLFATGVTDEEWATLSKNEKDLYRNGMSAHELAKIEEEERKKELAKIEYAKSFNELYEYDVVTVVNYGVVDANKLRDILITYAKNGWKLHTMYSNELGKNGLAIMGLGVNSTASQDVMIFERRIQNL